MTNVGSELGNRLAALADGEGCFAISRTRAHRKGRGVLTRKLEPYNYTCYFAVHMRADDAPFLRRMAEATGVGTVYVRRDPQGGNGKARWDVARVADLCELVRILDRYPLWSKKAADYAIWREAVLGRQAGVLLPNGWEALYERLRAGRAYREPEELAA